VIYSGGAAVVLHYPDLVWMMTEDRVTGESRCSESRQQLRRRTAGLRRRHLPSPGRWPRNGRRGRHTPAKVRWHRDLAPARTSRAHAHWR
jgi:hypothetical protein